MVARWSRSSIRTGTGISASRALISSAKPALSISREHGIGYEKRAGMNLIYTADDLATMARVRDVFDPKRMLNPEKIFPAGTKCGEPL